MLLIISVCLVQLLVKLDIILDLYQISASLLGAVTSGLSLNAWKHQAHFILWTMMIRNEFAWYINVSSTAFVNG